MDAALKMLCNYPATGKKIIVLSDMLELGEKAAKYHSDLFKSMNEMDLDLVVTCGELTNRKVMKEYKHKYECRSEEHTSELQSRGHLVCRLLLEKKNKIKKKLLVDR